MALVQKQLISHCNLLGKPVLITRVVDSMVTNPRPTRAEATGGLKGGISMDDTVHH
jgi:pyruvate kinase